MTERMRSRVQSAEMGFLCRVAGVSLRDRVRSSAIQEGLGVELPLLCFERSQLKWFGHLMRMLPGRLPREVVLSRPTGRRTRGRPRTGGGIISNCEAVYKKGHQHLYSLRKLSSFHIDSKMPTMFYHCFIESVISFSMVSWFSNLSLKNKKSLDQIVRWASRLIGEPQLNPESQHTGQLQRLAGSILEDPPPYVEFQPLPPGCRYKMPVCKTKRYRGSLVPSAVKTINSN